jgi:hypothetical protein
MTEENRTPQGELPQPAKSGIPGGSRQHVRSETEQGAVSRPGGATQHSGGALNSNAEEFGSGPGKGAD